MLRSLCFVIHVSHIFLRFFSPCAFTFQGCLPLVLMFDMKEDSEIDQGIYELSFGLDFKSKIASTGRGEILRMTTKRRDIF